MGIIKLLAIGAVVAYGVNYITKKRTADGKSIVDDISENAPEWMDKARQFGEQALDQVGQKVQTQTVG